MMLNSFSDLNISQTQKQIWIKVGFSIGSANGSGFISGSEYITDKVGFSIGSANDAWFIFGSAYITDEVGFSIGSADDAGFIFGSEYITNKAGFSIGSVNDTESFFKSKSDVYSLPTIDGYLTGTNWLLTSVWVLVGGKVCMGGFPHLHMKGDFPHFHVKVLTNWLLTSVWVLVGDECGWVVYHTLNTKGWTTTPFCNLRGGFFTLMSVRTVIWRYVCRGIRTCGGGMNESVNKWTKLISPSRTGHVYVWGQGPVR